MIYCDKIIIPDTPESILNFAIVNALQLSAIVTMLPSTKDELDVYTEVIAQSLLDMEADTVIIIGEEGQSFTIQPSHLVHDYDYVTVFKWHFQGVIRNIYIYSYLAIDNISKEWYLETDSIVRDRRRELPLSLARRIMDIVDTLVPQKATLLDCYLTDETILREAYHRGYATIASTQDQKIYERVLCDYVGLNAPALTKDRIVIPISYHLPLLEDDISSDSFHPIIRINIEGKKRWFVIDTGATASMINQEALPSLLRHQPQKGRYFSSATYMGLDGQEEDARYCSFEIAFNETSDTFSCDMMIFDKDGGIFGQYDELLDGTYITGIIGNDILSIAKADIINSFGYVFLDQPNVFRHKLCSH